MALKPGPRHEPTSEASGPSCKAVVSRPRCRRGAPMRAVSLFQPSSDRGHGNLLPVRLFETAVIAGTRESESAGSTETEAAQRPLIQPAEGGDGPGDKHRWLYASSSRQASPADSVRAWKGQRGVTVHGLPSSVSARRSSPIVRGGCC